jgi:diguanylate cyclase (GGDEF)-like protein
LCDGRVFERYSAPAVAPDGTSYGRVWSFNDITDRKLAEQRLEHQAFHDTLTGLPNRALLMERLRRALSRANRYGERTAVLFLDLDRFKNVNDSLGHEAGDQLLLSVARRLSTCLRPEDTAARLGGDEFVILVENIHEPQEAVRVAERIAECLTNSFTLCSQEVFTSTSIGIAINTLGSETPEDLLRDADAAMYRAKHRGRAQYEVFDKDMNEQALNRLQLETDLRRAVKRGEFDLYYQPVINLVDGSLRGAEALLRWHHSQRGMISPAAFVPIAEDTGLIIPIGRWVLHQACRQAKRWQEQCPGEFCPVSVNLSGRQFSQPHLADEIADVLRETNLDPSLLILEITETILMEDINTVSSTLTELKALGVSLAVDDFGTGYSSLSYLKRLPISTLKVDQSFVQGLGENPEDSAIVRAIVTMSKSLGLEVVAEGVETEDQRQLLHELGCDRAQGYLFSKPLQAPLLEEFTSTTVINKQRRKRTPRLKLYATSTRLRTRKDTACYVPATRCDRACNALAFITCMKRATSDVSRLI